MPFDPSLIYRLLGHATLPVAGAAAGGVTGGLFSDEGAEARGALQGALLGAGVGLGGKMGLEALKRVDAGDLALGGTLAGGGVAGLIGQRRLSPWVLEKLKLQEKEKAERWSRVHRPPRGGIDKDGSAKENGNMGMQEMLKQAREALNPDVPAEKKAGAEDFDTRLNAFEFGMEAKLKDLGIEKSAVAQAAQAPEGELALRTLAWVTEETEEAK